MAFDFGKVSKYIDTSLEANQRELTNITKRSSVGGILYKEDTSISSVSAPTESMFDDGKLFLVVGFGRNGAYLLLPYAPDDVVKFSGILPSELESAQEITRTEWYNVTERVKRNLTHECSANQAKFAVRILSMNPYRESDAMADERTPLTVHARITAIELKIIEDIICEVNSKELPTILQEQNCKTFGDLYATLDKLSVAEIGQVDTPDYLGVYRKEKHTCSIELYIDRLRYGNLRNLVRTTYIHELFHAYFDIFDNTALDKCNIKEIEEPLVEYAMLLTMKERYSRYYYNMAKKDVQQKKDSAYCYAIGSSSKLTPEVLRAYKYQKFLLDEKSNELVQYKWAVKQKRGLDACAKELKTLILQ